MDDPPVPPAVAAHPEGDHVGDPARLGRAVAGLLASHRRTGRPATTAFWQHDRSARRRHRSGGRPPRWHGWAVGADGAEGAAPTDVVLTVDGRWLASPRVLSAHGRRVAEPLPVPSPVPGRPGDWSTTWRALVAHVDPDHVVRNLETLAAAALDETG